MSHSNGAILILLVGSNPLPNYLAACALRPERVVLVYTPETRDAKDRLKRGLSASFGQGVSEALVDDATCSSAVRRVIDGQLAEAAGAPVWLNYTGGTKVMAAHARIAFENGKGVAEHSSYLDEGSALQGPRLRFDNGTSRRLADYPTIPLDLSTILALHGIDYTRRSAKAPAPSAHDAHEILCAVLTDVALASKLYGEATRLKGLKKSAVAMEKPFLPGDHGLSLSISSVPDSGAMTRGTFEAWCGFIGGEWLEEWLGGQIAALNVTSAEKIVVGVNARRGDKRANLEVDVAVVRGYRSYFISCTTDTRKPICKSKLFEVAVRSRQLGGELARAALVCLADDGTIAALQQDIEDLWGASNTTKVFGLSDLRAWAGWSQSRVNLATLRAWLES